MTTQDEAVRGTANPGESGLSWAELGMAGQSRDSSRRTSAEHASSRRDSMRHGLPQQGTTGQGMARQCIAGQSLAWLGRDSTRRCHSWLGLAVHDWADLSKARLGRDSSRRGETWRSFARPVLARLTMARPTLALHGATEHGKAETHPGWSWLVPPRLGAACRGMAIPSMARRGEAETLFLTPEGEQ